MYLIEVIRRQDPVAVAEMICQSPDKMLVNQSQTLRQISLVLSPGGTCRYLSPPFYVEHPGPLPGLPRGLVLDKLYCIQGPCYHAVCH